MLLEFVEGHDSRSCYHCFSRQNSQHSSQSVGGFRQGSLYKLNSDSSAEDFTLVEYPGKNQAQH
jgi:hypothetical protein